ncbi:MAG: hypothetical protein HOH20_15335 [Rhodospirillaceae bacterium]|nr:hypothetical protein [Rhodospirillaceae bacterium]
MAFVEKGLAMRISIFTALVLAVGFFLPPVAAQDSTFPTIKARTLNKDRITVPKGFTAARNILLLSFGRDMQESVDAWDAALASVRESSDNVQVYNAPLIPKPNGIIRGFINGGFRGIYKDEGMRDRVVILYIDEDEVFPALNISDDDKLQPLVMITDQAGVILGRIAGVVDDANVARVTELVTQ